MDMVGRHIRNRKERSREREMGRSGEELEKAESR